MEVLEFQFPTNGKVLLDDGMNIFDIEKQKFQFPTNGKVLLDEDRQAENERLANVSIPYKREGASGRVNMSEMWYKQNSFQFPTNGKVLLDVLKGSIDDDVPSFNSLQTGRCFWTPASFAFRSSFHFVSIPYKREGASGLGRNSLVLSAVT